MTHSWLSKAFSALSTCFLRSSRLSVRTPNSFVLVVYSNNLSPHLTGNKGPTNSSFCIIVISVFQVCRVSLLSSHQVRISIKSRLSFTTTSSALFNNWFIRQRAFIEIWSTWEVWRALKMLRVARGVAKSNSSFLSALQTSQVLHISMNVQLTYEPIVL